MAYIQASDSWVKWRVHHSNGRLGIMIGVEKLPLLADQYISSGIKRVVHVR